MRGNEAGWRASSVGDENCINCANCRFTACGPNLIEFPMGAIAGAAMPRFMKLGLVVCVAVGTFLTAGVPAAAAQTYMFNFFNGQTGSNLLSWDATISNVTCNPSCTLGPGDISGTLDAGGTDYALAFSTSNYGGPDNLFNINTGVDYNGIDLLANGVDYNVFEAGGPVNDSSEQVEVLGNGGLVDEFGTLTYSENAAPAPIAGGGLFSWLGLCVLGVAVWRKKLLSFARLALSIGHSRA